MFAWQEVYNTFCIGYFPLLCAIIDCLVTMAYISLHLLILHRGLAKLAWHFTFRGASPPMYPASVSVGLFSSRCCSNTCLKMVIYAQVPAGNSPWSHASSPYSIAVPSSYLNTVCAIELVRCKYANSGPWFKILQSTLSTQRENAVIVQLSFEDNLQQRTRNTRMKRGLWVLFFSLGQFLQIHAAQQVG